MSEEENKAIEDLRKILFEYEQANECGLSNNDFKDDIKTIATILNLIQKQQEEIEKKDKIIDKMAETMSRAGVGRRAFACDFGKECNENGCRVCIKQYFEKKVEGK